jgi:hypothetical protein
MPAERDPIRGKVARILNAHELAMNIGQREGVAVGMHFDVLDPRGEDIRDPDTQELLGSVDRPKVRVKVTRVAERLSIAATYREKKINVGGEGPTLDFGLTKYLLPPTWVTVRESLKTDERTQDRLDEAESYIKTGDPVVEVPAQLVDEAKDPAT